MTGAVARSEFVLLLGLGRVRAVLLACLVVPPVFALVARSSQSLPADTLFGRELHDSGFALPLVVLGFVGTWAIPALTALVGGDIFAAEDAAGTWPALLTRSCTRSQLYVAKLTAALAYALLVLLLLTASSLLGGLAVIGSGPLQDLGGGSLSAGTATADVLLSWLTIVLPTMAFTCLAVLLSVLTRRPALGVVAPLLIGLLSQLLALLPGLDPLRRVLPSTPLETWHGLLAEPSFDGPLLWGLLVALVWGLLCALAGWQLLLRRDFGS